MAGEFELPLGRLVMNFGAIEELLVRGISVMIAGDPKVGVTVARPLNFDSRLKVFDVMVRLKLTDTQQLADHEQLMKDLESLKQKRNSLVHGAWYDLEGSNIDEVKGKLRPTRLALHKGYVEGNMVNVTVEEVMIEAQFAEALYVQLVRFVEGIMK